MQNKTIESRRKALEETRSGDMDVVKAKETPGGIIAMATCRICNRPAPYTLQSVFVCVPCKYIRYAP